MTMLMNMQGLFGHKPTTVIMDSETTIPYESESETYEEPEDESQDDRGPLHSSPMPLEDFVARQKEHCKHSKAKAQHPKSALKTKKSKKKGGQRRSIRFATNPENGNVWCVVNTFARVPEKDIPMVWWQRQDFAEWSRANMNLARYVEEDYCAMLIKAYSSIEPHKDGKSFDITRHEIDQVDLDIKSHRLSKIGDIGRGLEPLVYPPINRIVKRQSIAVLNMQEILEDQGVDILASNQAMERIAHAAAKYSHASRVFAHKIADFDAHQSQTAYNDDDDDAAPKKERPKKRHSTHKKVKDSGESSTPPRRSSKHKASKDGKVDKTEKEDKPERKVKRHESDSSDHHKKSSSSKHHSKDEKERRPKRRHSTEGKVKRRHSTEGKMKRRHSTEGKQKSRDVSPKSDSSGTSSKHHSKKEGEKKH